MIVVVYFFMLTLQTVTAASSIHANRVDLWLIRLQHRWQRMIDHWFIFVGRSSCVCVKWCWNLVPSFSSSSILCRFLSYCTGYLRLVTRCCGECIFLWQRRAKCCWFLRSSFIAMQSHCTSSLCCRIFSLQDRVLRCVHLLIEGANNLCCNLSFACSCR